MSTPWARSELISPAPTVLPPRGVDRRYDQAGSSAGGGNG